jgi:hypothetical protein
LAGRHRQTFRWERTNITSSPSTRKWLESKPFGSTSIYRHCSCVWGVTTKTLELSSSYMVGGKHTHTVSQYVHGWYTSKRAHA